MIIYKILCILSAEKCWWINFLQSEQIISNAPIMLMFQKIFPYNVFNEIQLP